MIRKSINNEKDKEAVVACLRYYPSICIEGLKKTIENLDCLSPGQVFNPGLPRYEAGVLITWL
jgi:hypothetical protein